MKKQGLLVLIAVISLTAAGCNKTAESSLPVSSESTSSEVSSTQTAVSSESTTADTQAISYRAPLMTTKSWYSYEGGEQTVGVSFSVPKDWTIDSSIFYQNEVKVAEVVGVITLSQGQTLPSGQIKPDDEYAEGITDELVTEKTGTIAGLSYQLQITKAYPDGGDITVWYPNTYYLSDSSRVFVITFYSLEEVSEANQALYQEILSTFRFAE